LLLAINACVSILTFKPYYRIKVFFFIFSKNRPVVVPPFIQAQTPILQNTTASLLKKPTFVQLARKLAEAGRLSTPTIQ